MSSRHHIDDFMRGRIIGKIEEGRKITDVAREFDIAHSVVSQLWKSFKTTGMCSRRHGGGRVRRKQISRKTVARRLRGRGLYARRPVVCVPLTRQHCTACLQWCREHHNWTEQDWACVLFSDESRFSLSSDCRRQLIWRESGTAHRPKNIQEKERYPTCSIMVWAGIMINGRTRLHGVANGTMTGQRYIHEVLLSHVRLFRGAVGDKFVFMDDNATCHRTLAVQDCLDSEGIQCLVWPARSPDLNPIKNAWDALGRRVAGRNYPPTNKNTLIRALTEEWDKLPQQLLDNVVQRGVGISGSEILHVSFARRPGSERPRQTSRREDRHIIRNAHVHPTASSTAIQAQVAPSLGASVSSRTKRRCLAKGHLDRGAHYVDEFRINLSSDNNRVRVWRPGGERLNPTFALQRHTVPTAGVMVWVAIAYNTRSPLGLIRGSMTAQRYVYDILQPHVLPLMQWLPM
ncbi:transposable element Tcb2 transposase [Trichonephila clavipes]|nr:transposable element Tcb2 transposase [Trichonephila clavipes]